MKKVTVALLVIAVVGLIGYSQRATIAARIMERGLELRLFADRLDELEDGLHLALCGAGGPLPNGFLSSTWARTAPATWAA